MQQPPKSAKSDIVTAAYRTVHLREPDPGGLLYWSAFLQTGGSVEDMLRHFLMSPEFTANFQAFQKAYVPTRRSKFISDHSQYGEVAKLIKLLVDNSAKHRVIVDVGARGRDRSNSYDFLSEWGWRGLLIEANPALIETIKAEFAGLDCTVYHAAVSDREFDGVLHIGINDDVSSLEKANAECWGETRGIAFVPVRRLGTILPANNIPVDFDVLSLDIEGEDIKVLNDLIENTIYRPSYIIIEASNNFNTKRLDDLPFSEAVKQQFAIVDQTVANLILRRRLTTTEDR